ncbi:MAG TPA: DUF4157 domain-containing protein [Kofleriaceae bacterium]|nr:DUF4157 domain-containing protein [Kofleriaceae bacterium]
MGEGEPGKRTFTERIQRQARGTGTPPDGVIGDAPMAPYTSELGQSFGIDLSGGAAFGDPAEVSEEAEAAAGEDEVVGEEELAGEGEGEVAGEAEGEEAAEEEHGGAGVEPEELPFGIQMRGDGHEDSEAIHAAAARGLGGAADRLPYHDRIQRSFGHHDVGHVRAHVGGPATQACDAMSAEAYATGDAVAFRGAPSLHTAAHEAAHVVQQRAGVSLKGGVGAAGDRHEQHADRVADLVVRGASAEAALDEVAGAGRATAGVQRQLVDWMTKTPVAAPEWHVQIPGAQRPTAPTAPPAAPRQVPKKPVPKVVPKPLPKKVVPKPVPKKPVPKPVPKAVPKPAPRPLSELEKLEGDLARMQNAAAVAKKQPVARWLTPPGGKAVATPRPPAKPAVVHPAVAHPAVRHPAAAPRVAAPAHPAAAPARRPVLDAGMVAKQHDATELLAIFVSPDATADARAAAARRYIHEFLRLEPDLAPKFGVTPQDLAGLPADDLGDAWLHADDAPVRQQLRAAYVARLDEELAKPSTAETLRQHYAFCPFDDCKQKIRARFQQLLRQRPDLAYLSSAFGIGAHEPAHQDDKKTPLGPDEILTPEDPYAPPPDPKIRSIDHFMDSLDEWFRKALGHEDATAKLSAEFEIETCIPGLKFAPGFELSGGYEGGKFKLAGSVSLAAKAEVGEEEMKAAAELKGTLEISAEGADIKSAVHMMILAIRRRLEATVPDLAHKIFGDGPVDLHRMHDDDKASLAVGLEGNVSGQVGGAGAKISLGAKREWETTGAEGTEEQKDSDSREATFTIKGGLVASECKVSLEHEGASTTLGFKAKGTYEEEEGSHAFDQFLAQLGGTALQVRNGDQVLQGLADLLRAQLVGQLGRVPKAKDEGESTFEVEAKCVDGTWVGSIKLGHERKLELELGEHLKLVGNIDDTVAKAEFGEAKEAKEGAR